MAEGFSERLRRSILERGALCVGIDPSAALLAHFGRADDVEGLEFFARGVLEAVVDVAVAVKPQVAFFERFGSAGLGVLERLLVDARASGVLVVADAKRGDVASTNEGYAEAWLADGSPLAADALTVSPYLGVDALAPFFARAHASGRGVFVLAATSNDEGRTIQGARTDQGLRVDESVLASVRERNRAHEGPAVIGVVYGATRARPGFDLTTLSGPYLVPGVGAQGADASDVARLFEGCAPGTVLASVSRAILGQGPARRALRDAAARWRDDLSALL